MTSDFFFYQLNLTHLLNFCLQIVIYCIFCLVSSHLPWHLQRYPVKNPSLKNAPHRGSQCMRVYSVLVVAATAERKSIFLSS